jgi:curli biogenesis system outer membrane secretion channel CsgG
LALILLLFRKRFYVKSLFELLFSIGSGSQRFFMKESSFNFIPQILVPFVFIFFLASCAVIDQAIHPDQKSSSPSWPTFEQVLKENYKGPKARVAVNRFLDKSAEGKENSLAGDGMAEMLRNALLATNRYIIQLRRSSDDATRRQDITDSGRIKKDEEIDLLFDGTIKEFKHGIAGAGEETGGTSYVTLVITVTNSRTDQVFATERVMGKATDPGRPGWKGGGLPEVFKDFSKTPMEKAIHLAIEEAASFIVAKTPPESYRVFPAVPPKETPKHPPIKVQPEIASPSQPTHVTLSPPLRSTQVVWDSVNLREGPGTTHKVIGNAKKGASLKIIEVQGDWLRVRLGNGSEAWVSKLATSEAPKPTPPPPPPPSNAPPPPKPTPM